MSDKPRATSGTTTNRVSSITELQLSVATVDVAARMRARLAGLGNATPKVLWQRDGMQVLIDLASLEVRTVEGWLVCDIELRTDQTGAARLQLVFFLGERHEGDGVHASATIDAPGLVAAQLADAWGGDLQRVLWDAILDVVEISVQRVATDHPASPVTLSGFRCDGESIVVAVLNGSVT